MDYVPYDIAYYHDKLISKCALFTSEKAGLAKAHDLLPKGERSVSAMLNYFTSIGSGDSFRRMCVLDALILNIDRHLGNFGALIDNDTMSVIRMAPVFDNNRSLLFDMDIDQLKNTDWCIGTCTPRFGTDFISTARGMLTDNIRQDLEPLCDFSFGQHPNALSTIVREQVKRILD